MRRSDGRFRSHTLGGLLAAALALAPASTLAATLDVNSTADTLTAGDGECTLREAIINANTDSDATAGDCAAGSGADLIDVPAGTHALTRTGAGWSVGLLEEDAAAGDLDIAGDLTLRGAGANVTVIRSDTAYDGVFQVLGPAPVVGFERLTLTGGNGAPFGGGAIYSEGATVTVSDCVVSGSGGCGTSFGGFVCHGAINGYTLVLRRSAVVDNPSTGIVTGEARIEESTISRNVGPYLHSIGYAPYWLPSAVDADFSVEIVYSTVADNYLQPVVNPNPAASRRPAINAPSLNTKGSILSNPEVAGSWGDNCPRGVSAISGGHNIDSDGSCGLTDPTDLLNVDPMLGLLQDNGGPTPSHALLPGSPAIDAIPPADCTWDHDGDPGTPEVPLSRDQRGAMRPQGAGCEIGAFEVTLCSDALDNDADGQVDAADPGCRDGLSVRESPQCQDGLNNDNATGIDFDGGASLNGGVPVAAPDPQCTAGWKNQEAASSCGLGFELALLAPVLGRLARTRGARDLRPMAR